jgi:hypothetical protein
MYTYRLHREDGSDAGTATYAVLIQAGEEILLGNGRRFRVVDVVPFAEEDESPFVGLLQVQGRSAGMRGYARPFARPPDEVGVRPRMEYHAS